MQCYPSALKMTSDGKTHLSSGLQGLMQCDKCSKSQSNNPVHESAFDVSRNPSLHSDNSECYSSHLNHLNSQINQFSDSLNQQCRFENSCCNLDPNFPRWRQYAVNCDENDNFRRSSSGASSFSAFSNTSNFYGQRQMKYEQKYHVHGAVHTVNVRNHDKPILQQITDECHNSSIQHKSLFELPSQNAISCNNPGELRQCRSLSSELFCQHELQHSSPQVGCEPHTNCNSVNIPRASRKSRNCDINKRCNIPPSEDYKFRERKSSGSSFTSCESYTTPISSDISESDLRFESDTSSSKTDFDLFEVNVNCCVKQTQNNPVHARSLSHPGGKSRVTSSIHVDPLPHYNTKQSYSGTVAKNTSRSCTSVNLTLRPPSSEPQLPIDIQSSSSRLTYSSSSWNAKQGIRSQFQISIGPTGRGGSIIAERVRPRSCYDSLSTNSGSDSFLGARAGSLPDVTTSTDLYAQLSDTSDKEEDLIARLVAMSELKAYTKSLLERQYERKKKLQNELRKEKEKLKTILKEVEAMKQDLERRKTQQKHSKLDVSTLNKVQCLRLEIQSLQEECKKLTNEVDIKSDCRVPLGETDEAFYANIYTGQPLHFPSTQPPVLTVSIDPDPCQDGPSWDCSACTFHNHPLLDKCEQCEMLRIPRIGGETQDIHIHVRHHNFPNRRVIHSWVV